MKILLIQKLTLAKYEFLDKTECTATSLQKCSPFDDKWCDDCDFRKLKTVIKT
jgi:hypothetical protein